MKQLKLILGLIVVIIFHYSCENNYQNTLESSLKYNINRKIDTLLIDLNQLEKNSKSAKEHLQKSRIKYKKIEPFVEYYFQGFARRINGPALSEIKTDDNVVNSATGFQVLEEIIYADSIDDKALQENIKILKTDLLFVKNSIKDLPIQEHHFYELLQHQIIRIATLGITGLDSPVAQLSIPEAKYALEGIHELLKLHSKIKEYDVSITTKLLKKTTSYLDNNTNFDTFNRLLFIKNHLMPLSAKLEENFKHVLKNNPDFEKNKFFYGTLNDLMQGKKINPDALLTYATYESSPEKIAFGKLLFSDKNLSKNSTISCASCHIEAKAFTDGKPFSTTKVHNTIEPRNSPTVLYSALQKGFFYDLRAQDLENQIESVMKNPEEFGLTPNEISARLRKDTKYTEIIKKAFPDKKEITALEIRNAIATYVRSLMPFNSKIDSYFKNKTTLSKSEENGFNLFAGKAKCATCHFIPIYNGTIPPWYNTSESEVIGVPENVAWKKATIDNDLGRYNINQIEQLRFSFKTPTIRNSEKTSPYMHNGVYNNLEDVITFYEKGGGNGIGMDLKYQTLPFDNLKITKKEKEDLVNFIKALTDN